MINAHIYRILSFPANTKGRAVFFLYFIREGQFPVVSVLDSELS